MSFETILYELQEGVLTIALHRPEVLNAFNQKMGDELYSALKLAEADDNVRCILLTGEGRAFCSGQDLGDRSASDTYSLGNSVRERYNPIISKMRQLQKPIIAVVNGVAAGAGCSLALAADLRIASDKAKFTLAFAKIGLVPDSGASYFLPRLIGLGRAMEMALTARPVGAEEAYRIGLVNEVVEADQLSQVAFERARQLAQGPTRGLGLTKKLMYEGMESTLLQALEFEALAQESAGRTEDFREGVQAFMEKRPADFKGR